jgi:protein-disulfide isomerase
MAKDPMAAKGRRPVQSPGTPWGRWIGVLVGLAVAAVVVWWVVTRTGGDDAADDQTAAAEDGPSPQPLDLSGGEGPRAVDEASIANVPPDSLAQGGPDAPRGIDVSNDPRLGAPDATVEIVEFSDFQCPHCATFHTEIFPALRSFYGDRVRWYFVNRFYPAAHPHAESAAIAAECAARQGSFWEYADLVFARQQELGPGLLKDVANQLGLEIDEFERCRSDPATSQEVAADQREADRLGVDGTPSFYINGQKIMGAQPVGVFNEVLTPYFQ